MVCRELPTKRTWEMFTKRELTLQQEHGRLLQPLVLSSGALGHPYSPKANVGVGNTAGSRSPGTAPPQLHLTVCLEFASVMPSSIAVHSSLVLF